MTSALGRLAGLVWNRRSRRLRLPWRLAAFLLVAGAAGILTALASGWIGSPGGIPPLAARAPTLVVWTIAVLVALGVAAVGIDRRRLGDYGLRLDRAWLRDLGFGLALGAALMTGVFLLELALGWVTVTAVAVPGGGRFLPALSLTVVAFCCVGLYEELLARGYLVTNLAEGGQVGPVGPREATAVAVALSAAGFGAVHLTNPNATLASGVGITVAGVTLAAGYVLTGELAIPVGLHVTWNTFQSAVYGFPVSGVEVGVAVIAVRQRGPPLFTGGRFGPEAGLLGVGAALVGLAAIAARSAVRHPERGPLAPDPRVWTPDLRWCRGERAGTARAADGDAAPASAPDDEAPVGEDPDADTTDDPAGTSPADGSSRSRR